MTSTYPNASSGSVAPVTAHSSEALHRANTVPTAQGSVIYFKDPKEIVKKMMKENLDESFMGLAGMDAPD